MFRLIVLGTVAFFCFLTTLAPTAEAASNCGECLPRALRLTYYGDGRPGSVTPIIKMLPNTPQGCRQMNVKCPTPAGFPKTVMRFNGVGPPKVGKNLVALVSCVNTMYGGSWRTMYGGHWIWASRVKCTLN